MKNWSTKLEHFDKASRQYKIWRLEQLINFGLDKEKISKKELTKYFDELNIDSTKKAYLKFLLNSYEKNKNSR